MQFQLINQIDNNKDILTNILNNRGIEDIPHYLATTEDDILDPFLLRNMDKAIDLIQEHLAGNGRIYIQVDSDNDGMASSALLLNYLHIIMPDIVEEKFYWGLHEGKEHGIDETKIEEGTTLVIAPDASSNEYELHEKLHNQGIDVLVLDHHNADKESEYAVVVNNQLDDYPNKYLCGAGIVFKFCQALDLTWGMRGLVNRFRDLAAWAIVADMINLNNYETRQIVKTGLDVICNPFLKTFIEKNGYSFKDGVNPTSIAWSITPYINAIMRVGIPAEKELIFEAMLDWKAYEQILSTKRGHKIGDKEPRVEQAVRVSTNVKRRQETELEKMKLSITDEMLSHKILIIKCDENANRNLFGLIANKIANQYKQPVMLGRTEDGRFFGSGRAPGFSQVENFRQLCLDSELVEFAEGHDQAFGFSILEKDLDNFIKFTDETLKDIDFIPAYNVDCIFSTSDLDEQVILQLGELKDLWGQGIPEPMIAITKVLIHDGNIQLMSKDKNPTLKFILGDGIECIKFKSSEEEFNKLLEGKHTFINLIGTCAINEWNFNITPQIKVKDYEIIGTQEYYF